MMSRSYPDTVSTDTAADGLDHPQKSPSFVSIWLRMTAICFGWLILAKSADRWLSLSGWWNVAALGALAAVFIVGMAFEWGKRRGRREAEREAAIRG